MAAEGDGQTCAAVADLIVDGLAIAVGAVTDSVTIPMVGHVGQLTGQPPASAEEVAMHIIAEDDTIAAERWRL